MARLSKAQPVAVEEEEEEHDGRATAANKNGIPSPRAHSAGNASKSQGVLRADSGYSHHDTEPQYDFEDESTTLQLDVDDADDERRQSAFTSASISSLPESTFDTDYERGAMHTPYTPPMIRPSFRRPESVKKMQMSSPTPSERSLRRSLLSPTRARTPKSGHSSVKGSPARSKWAVGNQEMEKKEFPLVLLHVTLLPINLPWSRRSMEDILPASTLESLRLLRSKVSETILQRGILIPHPSGDYELLEERLLEALELKPERITKCGHFRSRSSVSSTDSGVGSSVEGLEDDDACDTCHRHLKPINAAISARGRKWTIKVFAANGLMRASAWTAAWTEMERIDVEILPYIGEDLRTKLDTEMLEEAAEEEANQQEEARKASEAEQEFRTRQEQLAKRSSERRIRHPAPIEDSSSASSGPPSSRPDDLPRVYQPKDIPLSLLLRNYFFLLAQDKRNVLLFGLTAIAVAVTLRASLMPRFDISGLAPPFEHMHAEPLGLQNVSAANIFEATHTSIPVQAPVARTELHTEEVPTPATVVDEVFGGETSTSTDAPPTGVAPAALPTPESVHQKEEAPLENTIADDRDWRLPPSTDAAAGMIDTELCRNTASTLVMFGQGWTDGYDE
ncbi:hypothetical protein CERZMDRAFT_93565 [Cercospora zeae-maydis SCOH1-5]|uniref:Pathway-specific nitrogen regulator n=1 Tax=Cercospora zeae-maydis SCOH1-5 TaxID=717836 RepID=A0A6A6FSC3_9PEZI|nr:hypothetical protein CERZMDRAFT_93565 [Cercospora zeae-maydis SCOH1-5]